jgi:hypothetical protein
MSPPTTSKDWSARSTSSRPACDSFVEARTVTSILWRRIDLPGMERAELATTEDGYRLAGTTLLSLEERPVEIRYSIALDGAWHTRIVGVHVRTPEENRSVALRSDGAGSWDVGGESVPDLAGAVDVDLAWTPATHTISIRRLALEVGGAADIPVAHVPFPQREVAVKRHTYERIAARRYRFTSGDFATDLTVNEHEFVTAYPGLWISVTDT